MSAILPLVWCAPIYEATGYADEARGMVLALEALGVPVILRPVLERQVPGFRDQLPAAMRETLARQEQRKPTPPFLLVQHFVADGFVPTDAAAAVIGRTMFESDALPPAWTAGCNALDTLWVPSQFNIESFRRAGVTVPMAVVPGGVESAQYTPDGVARPIAGARGTVFLSVFEWRQRKGWDVLLRAWAAAFTASDDVSLVLRTYVPGFGSSPDAIVWLEHTIDTFLRESCGRSRSDVAPIVLIPELVPESEVPALYRAAHAYVSPTRGEGWGRPLMEAMACGLPVIATRWSAHLEYMNDDNSLLIDVDGLTSATDPDALVYRDTQWAEPNVDHLVAHLRTVHVDRARARAIGERARRDMVANWTWERAAQVILTQVRELSDTYVTGLTARTPSLASDTPARVLLNATAFSAPTTPMALTALMAPLHRLSADNVGTLHVFTQPDSERPALASALHAVWRDRIDASTVAVRASDVCLTWCGLGDGEPAEMDPRGISVVCTGDAVLDAVPEPLARSLRDQSTEIWVPHAAAEAAVIALGIAPERVMRVPDMRMLDASFVDALNSTGGTALAPRRRVFLAVRTPKDVAAAELTVRLWPRVSGSAAELAIRIDRESEDTVREWGASLARRTRETRGLEHVSVWEERFALASIPSLLRRADVLLVPHVTVLTPTWLAVARELGCAVIAPQHPLLVDWPEDTVWRVGAGTGVTLSGAQLAPALSALCTTDALHARHAAMRALAATLPTPDAVAAMLVARIVALVLAREARA